MSGNGNGDKPQRFKPEITLGTFAVLIPVLGFGFGLVYKVGVIQTGLEQGLVQLHDQLTSGLASEKDNRVQTAKELATKTDTLALRQEDIQRGTNARLDSMAQDMRDFRSQMYQRTAPLMRGVAPPQGDPPP